MPILKKEKGQRKTNQNVQQLKRGRKEEPKAKKRNKSSLRKYEEGNCCWTRFIALVTVKRYETFVYGDGDGGQLQLVSPSCISAFYVSLVIGTEREEERATWPATSQIVGNWRFNIDCIYTRIIYDQITTETTFNDERGTDQS